MKTSNENNGGFTYNFVTIVLTFSIMLAVWNTFETCDMNDKELYDYVINTVMTSKGKGTGLGQEMEN